MKTLMQTRIDVLIAGLLLCGCGGAQATANPSSKLPQQARPSDENALLTLINQDRVKAGLAALQVETEVREVARNHSAEMAEKDFVAHISPTTGSPDDRLKAAKASSSLALENVGAAPDVELLHLGFMNSPEHRKNILDREVTHAGVGIVAASRTHGETLYATELFVWRPQPLNTARAVGLLMKHINAARRSAGRSPLVGDPAFSRAARAAAADALARPSANPEEIIAEAAKNLHRHVPDLRSLGGAMLTLMRLEEIAEVDAVRNAHGPRVGVAFTQGSFGEISEANVVVVLVEH